MLVYLVNKICDYEYGCREVVGVFNSIKSAENYINKQPDKGDIKFWDGSKEPMYNIDIFEVE